MTRRDPIWVSFGPERMLYASWYHALRTAKIMAQVYGKATVTHGSLVVIFYRID